MKHKVWEGPVDEQGLPHGRGKMTYPPRAAEAQQQQQDDDEGGDGGDGGGALRDTFIGEMVHGERHGRGRYVFVMPRGSGKGGGGGGGVAVFEGEYAKGQRVKGALALPDGGRFEGAFGAVNGLPEGEGVYVYPSGDVYQGSFVAGKKDGRGVYRFKGGGGCQLHGVWRAGELAEGRWVLRDGSAFAGAFGPGARPAQGAHFCAASGLLQEGRYAAASGDGGNGGGGGGGGWVASSELKVGSAGELPA